MLTYLRYALATFCFAASVGFLALWGLSEIVDDGVDLALPLAKSKVTFEAVRGVAIVGRVPKFSQRSGAVLYFFNLGDEWRVERLGFAYDDSQKMGIVGVLSPFCFFRIWYAVLICLITGFAVLRMRRFTLRSMMIAMTVAAGLLGMAMGPAWAVDALVAFFAIGGPILLVWFASKKIITVP